NPVEQLLKAYLYWAGSGTSDFEIQLNEQNEVETRSLLFVIVSSSDLIPYHFFSDFADVTSLVHTIANFYYAITDLYLRNVIYTDLAPCSSLYFQDGTNF